MKHTRHTPHRRAAVAAVLLHAADAPEKQPDYTSRFPKFRFADTLQEQEVELKSSPLMLRFAESRHKLAGDPHRPLYHFVSPESTSSSSW